MALLRYNECRSDGLESKFRTLPLEVPAEETGGQRRGPRSEDESP